jgi:predicted nucleotidyltransferase
MNPAAWIFSGRKRRQRGMAHAALFGSRARGDQVDESDTGTMIEFDPGAWVTIFDYAGLPAATADAIYTF